VFRCHLGEQPLVIVLLHLQVLLHVNFVYHNKMDVDMNINLRDKYEIIVYYFLFYKCILYSAYHFGLYEFKRMINLMGIIRNL
jgi:hypothetical protein